jgi:anthranilate synthase/aminodeoxychorismate synthase-like glutamine amidotransferase
VILVIDNYDSFTYNLVQYLLELGAEVLVRRNDAIDVGGVRALSPEALVISPGPGAPESAGVSNDVLRDLAGELPILGVCLGHQCLGRMAGARVSRARRPVHGKASAIYHDGETIFEGLPSPFYAGRYHSLIVADEGLPAALEVSARSEEGEIMGLRLRGAAVEGVQFHPESILSPEGKRLLHNFVRRASRGRNRCTW